MATTQVTGILTVGGTTAASIVGPIRITDDQDRNGAVSIQLGAGATGTVVLEVSANEVDWQIVNLTNPAISTERDQASMTAAGLFWAEIVGIILIRARMSVTGTAKTTLTYRNS